MPASGALKSILKGRERAQGHMPDTANDTANPSDAVGTIEVVPFRVDIHDTDFLPPLEVGFAWSGFHLVICNERLNICFVL